MDHVDRSRSAYGGSADRYLELIGSSLSEGIEMAEDLAALARFAGSRGAAGAALDAGCGTGRVARLLADHGHAVVGLDVAAEMVEIARRRHPDVAVTVGAIDRLPFTAGRFEVVVSWYSIITTPPDELATVFDEFRRVLVVDGRLLVAFQAGEGGAVDRPCAFGTDVDLTLYRHAPHDVVDQLEVAGFHVDEVVERGPVHAHEDSGQAVVRASILTSDGAHIKR